MSKLSAFFGRYSTPSVILILQVPILFVYVIGSLFFQQLPWQIAYKAYLIAFLFVGSALWILEKSWQLNANKFLTVYYLSTIIRFILIITLIALSISRIKFDQMFFSVSLIISYIYNSIIELLLIHHRLWNDSSNNDKLP
ncbi:MAG: hypothetical protein EBR32_02115 [Bacteroidetes bacterium]|nr:hypothetical protein [Bacteroidota bacterium]